MQVCTVYTDGFWKLQKHWQGGFVLHGRTRTRGLKPRGSRTRKNFPTVWAVWPGSNLPHTQRVLCYWGFFRGWMAPCPGFCSRPEQAGVGLDDLQRSLPTLIFYKYGKREKNGATLWMEGMRKQGTSTGAEKIYWNKPVELKDFFFSWVNSEGRERQDINHLNTHTLINMRFWPLCGM